MQFVSYLVELTFATNPRAQVNPKNVMEFIRQNLPENSLTKLLTGRNGAFVTFLAGCRSCLRYQRNVS